MTCATMVMPTGFCLHDLRTRLTPSGSSCQGFLPTSFPNFASGRTQMRLQGEVVIVIRRFLPGSPGRLRSIDRRKTRFDLRHALHCDSVAVTGRTLSQSARTAHSFELLFACSISGTPGSPPSLFPARLRIAGGLRRQLRQPGCDSKLSVALAHNLEFLVHSADHFRLQNL